LARTEKYKVRYVAPGVATRTFTNADDAVKFVGELEPGSYLSLQHIIEEDMAEPKALKLKDKGTVPPAVFNVPSVG
jgi:hypothetical protein